MAKLSHYEKILVFVFFLSLPLINPWVRGDGVGYYAFARAFLIQHDLNFTQDWLRANPSFRMGRTDAEGNILPAEYTPTATWITIFRLAPRFSGLRFCSPRISVFFCMTPSEATCQRMVLLNRTLRLWL